MNRWLMAHYVTSHAHCRLDSLNVDVDVVLRKTVNLNLYWTVNFSFLLSSPPLWIVAIHDLWVSPLLTPVDDVKSSALCCTELEVDDLIRLRHLLSCSFDTQDAFVLWHFISVLSALGCPSVWSLCLSLAVSHCSSFLWLLQEQEFLQKQQQELDGALKKIIQQHKLEIATIERDCLNHKQQLMRGGRWR